VDSANGDTDFPVQNLPAGVYSRSRDDDRRIGIAIGEYILDLRACIDEKLVDPGEAIDACREDTLNALMSLPAASMRNLRSQISDLLAEHGTRAARGRELRERILVRMSEAAMHVPARVGDYTDFYASIHHATNVGSMFRPDNPLLPNYKYIPIGYHGRASSIVASGAGIRRPNGQTRPADTEVPTFGPSKMVDYESELGFFIRGENLPGEPVPMGQAADRLFGFCLVNDWSARDIQTWEYQPLGPFLSKSFATTVSPWVVMAEAVTPYRMPVLPRGEGDPEPLDYLRSSDDVSRGALSAFLEVWITSGRMREKAMAPVRLSRAPFSSMYWTVTQMIAHHASNGCNLRPGDLLASGTVSGSAPDSRGCLLELTWRGSKPITLPTGEERKFLQDGDEVIMKGSFEAPGRTRIGLGECRGVILPAR
jgi:fumarylacetoacetase